MQKLLSLPPNYKFVLLWLTVIVVVLITLVLVLDSTGPGSP